MSLPLRLGHRGARAFRHIPENTLASFELCLQHGCDGFEFDVRLSADGQAVICHDASFRGWTVSQTTAQTLELPRLDDVLRQFSARAFLDIELKVTGLETAAMVALRDYPPQKKFVVSSFLPEVIATTHALDAAVPLGLLCENREQLKNWRDTPAEWVMPRYDLASSELVAAVHKAGKRVAVWTVNRAERMREFAAWQVDAIISDETELLLRTLK